MNQTDIFKTILFLKSAAFGHIPVKFGNNN